LTDALRARGDVTRTQYISADDALAEFKERSGFGDALNGLGENPLPASVIIYLKAQSARADSVARLIAEVVARPEVDSARSDTEWIERLHVTLRLVERAVIGLALLLVFAVIIIISNTIRLAVLNRRDEIEIIKLIGGTNTFIRRPFLYAGLLQGVAGAALAVGLVLLSVQLMRHPTAELARLYASGFVLQGLDWRLAGALLVAGGVLGWVASRWSVGRHLAAIEPR
jgi:cell division transport system permease protein